MNIAAWGRKGCGSDDLIFHIRESNDNAYIEVWI